MAANIWIYSIIVDRHTTKTVTSIQRTHTHCYETRLKTVSGSFSQPYTLYTK